MTVFSKRNALIGWTTWMVSKRMLKAKGGASKHSKKSKAAAAAALVAVGGAVFFWRKRQEPMPDFTSVEQPVQPTEQPTSV